MKSNEAFFLYGVLIGIVVYYLLALLPA